MKPLKFLGIDTGNLWGWAYLDEIGEETGHGEVHSLVDFERIIKELLERFKPHIVVTAAPTQYIRTIAKQSKWAAIIELCCEKKDIIYVEENDAHMRKEVMGAFMIDKTLSKAERRKKRKQEIMDYFHKDNSEEADALMMATFLFNAQATE